MEKKIAIFVSFIAGIALMAYLAYNSFNQLKNIDYDLFDIEEDIDLE
jgi:hypothetical protein